MFNYTLKHFIYLDDGRLEIDNNRSEHSIKPFVIGCKNWIFHVNAAGAHAGATLYSFIETCKAHDVDVFVWIKYALDNIQQSTTAKQLEQLLPFNVAPQQLELARSIPDLIFPENSAV